MILKSSVDFSDLIDALDNPHQYEGYLSSLCPFHEDHNPSFFVYADTYKCLSCGAFGKTSSLLEKLGKIVRVPNPRSKEAYPVTNPFTRWMKEHTMKQTLKMAWQTINQNSGMGNYLVRDRGIDEPYRKLLGIGYMDDWYTIPIRNKHGMIISAIARKGRDNHSLSKYVLPHNTDPHLLYIPNQKRVRKSAYLIITFGILDAIVLSIMGYPSASTITGKRLSKLSVASFRIPILVIPDRQEESEGMLAMSGLGWRGSMAKMQWPDGCKDINDIWMRDRDLCRDLLKEVTHGIT